MTLTHQEQHNVNLTLSLEYLALLSNQRRMSAHTISAYKRDIEELFNLLGNKAVGDITTASLRSNVARLRMTKLSTRSISRTISAWRGFFDWLVEEKYITINPTTSLKIPRQCKPLPKALNESEAARLVENKNPNRKEDDPYQLCNLAMFELLYSSGLRVSELTGLDVVGINTVKYISLGWVNLDEKEITVTGKGLKIRVIPVGVKAIAALEKWLAVRSKLVKDGGASTALFLTARGTRMSSRVVQLRLKEHAKAIGLETSVHPHVLRHSFASHVLQSSSDLRAVQEMLGHTSIASTQIYTALDFQHLASVYDAAHPRAKNK